MSTFVLIYKEQYKSDCAVAMLNFFGWIYRDGVNIADDLDYPSIAQNLVELIESRWVAAVCALIAPTGLAPSQIADDRLAKRGRFGLR